MKKLRLHWYCLDLPEPEQQRTQQWLEELRQFLARPPTELDLGVSNLPPDMASVVDLELRQPPRTIYPLEAYYEAIDNKLHGNLQWAPLLVRCPPDSRIALVAKKEHPIAKWGITCNRVYSLVYRMNNKYIVWHEVLHLLGANDCYCPKRPEAPRACGLAGCIMQYAPTQRKVAAWPFLCSASVAAVRSYAPIWAQGD